MDTKYSLKRIVLIIIYVILIAAGVIFLTDQARRFFDHYSNIKNIYDISDISRHKITQCPKVTEGNIWLLSYADGRDVYLANQNALVSSALNKCIDNFMISRKTDIDEDYLQAHNKILNGLRGAGYWLWKPYLIGKALKTIPENDILIYLDAGTLVMKPVTDLISQMNEHDILISELHNNFKVIKYTKKSVLESMNVGTELLNKPQHQANIILIRNNKSSRKFIKSWLEWSEKPEIIMDEPKDKSPYPEFIDHRHDQAILSILIHQNMNAKIKILPISEIEEYFLIHRRRRMSPKYSLLPLFSKPEIVQHR